VEQMSDENMIDDELLEDFLTDAYSIIEQAKPLLANFNESQDPQQFEAFGQIFDRIMGAAYTLGFMHVGDLSKMGKELGYKSSQLTDLNKLITIHGLLSQLVKETEKNLNCLKKKILVPTPGTASLIEKLQQVNASMSGLRASLK
jgi:chemotaxis protein histidine kinase CheA